MFALVVVVAAVLPAALGMAMLPGAGVVYGVSTSAGSVVGGTKVCNGLIYPRPFSFRPRSCF